MGGPAGLSPERASVVLRREKNINKKNLKCQQLCSSGGLVSTALGVNCLGKSSKLLSIFFPFLFFPLLFLFFFFFHSFVHLLFLFPPFFFPSPLST